MQEEEKKKKDPKKKTLDKSDTAEAYIKFLQGVSGADYSAHIFRLQALCAKGKAVSRAEWSEVFDEIAPIVAYEILRRLEALEPKGLVERIGKWRAHLENIQSKGAEAPQSLQTLKGSVTKCLLNDEKEYHDILASHARDAEKHGEEARRRSDWYNTLLQQTKAMVHNERATANQHIAQTLVFQGKLMSRAFLPALKEWNNALIEAGGNGIDMEGATVKKRKAAKTQVPMPMPTTTIVECDLCGKQCSNNRGFGAAGFTYCASHFFKQVLVKRYEELQDKFNELQDWIKETKYPEDDLPDDFPFTVEMVIEPFDAVMRQYGLTDHSEIADDSVIPLLRDALIRGEALMQLPKGKEEEEQEEEESFEVPDEAPMVVADDDVEEEQRLLPKLKIPLGRFRMKELPEPLAVQEEPTLSTLLLPIKKEPEQAAVESFPKEASPPLAAVSQESLPKETPPPPPKAIESLPRETPPPPAGVAVSQEFLPRETLPPPQAAVVSEVVMPPSLAKEAPLQETPLNKEKPKKQKRAYRKRERVPDEEEELEKTPEEPKKLLKPDWEEAFAFACDQNKIDPVRGQVLLELLRDGNVAQVLAAKGNGQERRGWIVITTPGHVTEVLVSRVFGNQMEAKRYLQQVKPSEDTPYFSWHVKEI